MSFAGGALPPSRLRGPLAGVFAVAFAATGTALVGAVLIVRARPLVASGAEARRYHVVARIAEMAAARRSLDRLPGVRVLSEQGAGEILARSGVPTSGPEHLGVFEVQVEGQTASRVASLRALDPVLDVAEVEDGRGDEGGRGMALRRLVGGGALIAFGAGLFASAVWGGARIAGRECREEIGVRLLLGEEAAGLWGPLGLCIGLTGLGGVAAAVVVALLVGGAPAARIAGMGLPEPWLALAGAALCVGTMALSFRAARGAVMGAVRKVVFAGSLLLALLGPNLVLAAALDPGVPRAKVVRALSRDLSVCRRARHLVEKGIVATERQAIAAFARGDAGLVRLAALKRRVDQDRLRGWSQRCRSLRLERDRAREALRAVRWFGPAAASRRAPVEGAVVVRYGEAGDRPGTAGYRHGIALRTRAGEAVRASAGGRVVYAGDLPGAGPVVVVGHARRTYSVYAGLERLGVAAGQVVEVGEPVARAREGLLYFSVRHRGHAVDPLAWLARPSGWGAKAGDGGGRLPARRQRSASSGRPEIG